MEGIEDRISLTEFTIKFARMIKRNLVLILGVIVLTTALGVVYSFIKTPRYETFFTGYSSAVKNEHVPSIFSALNQYIEENQYEELSQIMGITVEDAALLKEINAFKSEGITEKDAIPDGMPRFENNVFTVEIATAGIIDFRAFQKGCVGFVGRSPFVKNKVANKARILQGELDNINEQIELTLNAQAELTKAIQTDGTSEKVKIIGSEVVYPQKSTFLYGRKKILELEIAENVPMIIVQDIVPSKKPIDKKVLIWSTFFGLGLILALLTASLKELVQKL